MQSTSALRLFALASSVLASGTFAQSPNLSPPLALSGDAAVSVAAGEQTAPAIAAGGGGYLVVWNDARSNLGGSQANSDLDVYARRLDAAGVPLDVTPIPIATGAGWQRNPQVAWNGENWLVAWENQDPTATYWGAGISAVRVSPAGVVLDAAPIVVRPGVWSSSVLWAMCANGADWVVASEGTSAGENDLVGRRVGANGTLLDPASVVLVPADYFLHFSIRVLASQGEVLLSWSGQSSQLARRFSASLVPIGASFSVPGSELGSNGTGYYVVWYVSPDVVGSPMALDGTLAIPSGAPILPAYGLAALPTWDGTRWWVASLQFQAVAAARVTSGGSVLDPGGVTIASLGSASVSGLQIAGGLAGGMHATWDSYTSTSGYDVRGCAASANLAVGATIDVANGAPAQLRSDVCAGPDGYVVVFESHVDGQRRVMVQRLDPNGVAIDPEPQLLGSAQYAGGPAVAWNGSVYCLAWNDGTNVVVRRMRPDGSFVDPAPLVAMPGASADVAAVGDVFLVVTTHSTFNWQYRATFVRRFDGASGQFLDGSALAAPNSGTFAQLARVSTLADQWIVVWQSNYSHDNAQAAELGIFVRGDGTFGPQLNFTIIGGAPHVAGGVQRALVAWQTNSTSNANNDIACRTVALDGSLGPVTVVSAAIGRQMKPAVAWDGDEWWIAWEDQRNQTSFFDQRTDVYGARVNAGGSLLDPAGFAWNSAVDPVVQPALAVYGARTLLSASAMHPEAPYGAHRLSLVRTIGDCAAPASYCTALPNSTGAAAHIGASGSSSFSANDLVLTCTNVPAGTNGIFFFGDRPRMPAAPFGNGLLCVGGALRRLPIVSAPTGTAVQAQDLGSFSWAGIGPGHVRDVQFWFRDAAAGGSNTNTSDALELTFCP